MTKQQQLLPVCTASQFHIQTVTATNTVRNQHAGSDKQAPGLVPRDLLERGDGAHARGTSVLRENYLRQRDSGKTVGVGPD